MNIDKVTPAFLLTLFSLCSALMGAVYFVFYFHIIGRSDLIMSVMLDNISVFYVFAALLVAGGVAMVLQLMPSVLLYLVFGIVRGSDVKEKEALRFSLILFFLGVVFVMGLLALWVEYSVFYTKLGITVFFL